MRIGVFDSGIGGITVLNALRKRFPHFDFVYLGDTANVPYGTKSPAQIEKLSVDCIHQLQEKKVDAIVVACNTASSWALKAMRQAAGATPVFGVVEPGVEAVLKSLSAGSRGTALVPLLVLATRATVHSQAYAKALWKALEDRPGVALVMEQACPLLVPMIEEGWVDHPILHQTIAEYIRPFLEKYPTGVALLGCTHYPWVQAAFEKALPGWTVLNSAEAVADSLGRVITTPAMIAGADLPEKKTAPVEWIFTDPEAVPSFARGWIKTHGYP